PPSGQGRAGQCTLRAPARRPAWREGRKGERPAPRRPVLGAHSGAHMHPLTGGRGRLRSEAHMAARAIREGWGTPEEGRGIIDQMLADMRTAESPRDRAACAKVVVALAMRDVQAARNATLERQGETTAILQLLKARAQSDPAVRALLCELTEAIVRQGQNPSP